MEGNVGSDLDRVRMQRLSLEAREVLSGALEAAESGAEVGGPEMKALHARMAELAPSEAEEVRDALEAQAHSYGVAAKEAADSQSAVREYMELIEAAKEQQRQDGEPVDENMTVLEAMDVLRGE